MRTDGSALLCPDGQVVAIYVGSWPDEAAWLEEKEQQEKTKTKKENAK
jgi:hypothetical protein